MRGEIRNAAHRITLNLDVRAQHLADKRFQAAELDNKELVVGWWDRGQDPPSQHHYRILTVDGKVSESGAGSTLNFGIMAAEKEEDGIKGFAANGSDLFLSDFSKSKSGAPLEVDVVGKRECCQRGQRGTREEVGIRAIWVQR